MNQEQRRKLYEKGFNDGVDSLNKFMIEALYGAAALAGHREFGFDTDQCLTLLNSMNQIVTEHFTSAEIIQEAWDEIGLHVVMDDGIEPFQKNEE